MIKEIIDLLSNDEKSLSTPLLKTQVFASRVGNENLYIWVTKELNGFSIDDEVPEYRIAKASPMGTISQGYRYEQNIALPVSIFGHDMAQKLIKFKIDDGVKSLEEVASGKYGDTILKPLAMDMCAMLTKMANDNGFDFVVTDGRILVHVAEFVNSLSKIRAKLLDLILKVEQEYPDIDNIILANTEEKLEVNQAITHIMTQININSSGQGNIVTSGSDNTITAHINIGKGDIEALKEVLLKYKVTTEDANELTEIVRSEEPVENELGQNTKNWLSKMVNKSINGTWEVGVATAAGLLVEILKKYYGL